MDGYLGWSLAQYLVARGHEIGGADAFLRRQWVKEMGSHSILPIASISDRLAAFQDRWGAAPFFREGDLRDYGFVESLLRDFGPDAIVHLGECPSAPYSQIDIKHATEVQGNNILSTLNILFAIRDVCPGVHLVKLGTMGEYGTPNLEIPEGFFEVNYRDREDTLPFPRQAGSWYHLSKVHDSHNVMFTCRVWGLRSTDIMQGIVYGSRIDEMQDDERLLTRFDVDQCFGTVLNRFCAQAVIGHPLTLHGKGHQKRGFIALRDAMQCLSLVIEKPARAGEYRVFNQFEEVYDLTDLALKVKRLGGRLGMKVEVCSLENPRVEREEHFYNPDHDRLAGLGYRPSSDLEAELALILADLEPYRERIEAKRELLVPDIRWDGTHRKAEYASVGPSKTMGD